MSYLISVKKRLVRRGPSNHLFSRKYMTKRVQATFCAHHRDCEYCNLEVLIISKKFQHLPNLRIVMSRYEGRRVLTDEELVYKLMMMVENLYVRTLNAFDLQVAMSPIQETRLLVSLQTPPNQILLHQRLLNTPYPSNQHLPMIWDAVKDYYREWDRHQLRHFKMEKQMFEGAPPINLAQMAALKFSTYHMTFGSKFGFNNSFMSKENFYPKKLPMLLNEYSNDTHYMTQNAKNIMASHGAKALSMMYDYMGVKKYFKTRVFTFDLDDLHLTVSFNPGTSAGPRKGPSIPTIQICNVTYKVTSSGKKIDQLEFVLQEIQRAWENYLETGRFEMEKDLWSIAYKQEVFNAWDKATKAEYEKMANKCREFFIPFCKTYFISSIVGTYRQNIERGSLIKIGFRWWKGGAYELAKQLRYTENVTMGKGDVKKMDKHIKRHLLNLFSSENLRYYNFSDVDKTHGDFFKELVEWAGDSLAVKVVNTVGDRFVVMNGVLPSGAYETSHANSWIMGYLYFLFLAHCATGPNGTRVMQAVASGAIVFVVYGDDHILSTPTDLWNVCGEHKFKEFVLGFGLIIQDDGQFPFLSRVGKYGELIVPGISFLQHYFVLREEVGLDEDYPPVLPFRPSHKTIVKVPYGSGAPRSNVDNVLAVIGMAYDSKGTNEYTYLFLRGLYATLIEPALAEGSTPGEDVENFLRRVSGCPTLSYDITKLLRKGSITLDELANGFPERISILQKHLGSTPEYHNLSRFQPGMTTD